MSWIEPFTKLFPKCLTTVLFVWTCWCTIVEVNSISTVALIFTLIPIVILSLYTYFKVIEVGPGSPLDFPELYINDIRKVEQGIELPPEFLSQRSLTIKNDGRFRICRTCNVWKPDRSHHCSSCNICVLKMDHHCPWFAECVGFKNQKYFIQFLQYATVYSILVLSLTSFELCTWYYSGSYETEFINFQLLFLWIFAGSLSISIICFTGFSVYQAIKNRTTIEMYALRKYKEELELYSDSQYTSPSINDNIFDLGSIKENWQEVMGSTITENILPIPTYKYTHNKNTLDEKGLYFRVNSNVHNNLLESANLQDRLLRRLTPRSSINVNR